MTILGKRCLFRINIGQPIARRFTLSLSNLKEHLLNTSSNLSATTAAYGDPVDRTNGRNLSGRAGEEKLIRNIERCALNASLLDFDPQLVADLNHAVARDSRQY